MTPVRQTTVRGNIVLNGFGVHSAGPASIIIKPAGANHGIVFMRSGLEGGVQRRIPARYGNVSITELCTVLGDPRFGAVSTVEHLMAALYGLSIDNALIAIDGPEVPIMDGSAAEFVAAIRDVGVMEQASARRVVRVLKPVRVERGAAWCELSPHDGEGLSLDVSIDFDTAVIGRQTFAFELTPESFVRDVARARTFGFLRDVEMLWKNGYALGSSLENTVVVGDDAVVNPDGLRFADEFVRHKALDAVGDLSLAGLPLVGAFRSHCSGHRLNVAILRELFSDPANFEIVERELPAPARRVSMAAAAYAPSHG